MYRPRRHLAPMTLIILGVLVGVIFLAYDRLSHQQADDSAVPTLIPATIVSQAASPATTVPQAAIVSTPLPEAEIINTSLFIPKAGIFAPIVRVYLDGHSWDVSKLGMNVGHLQGTTWLDNGPGNIVLSGHVEMADGRAGVFATISELEPGDLVVLQNGADERRYAVTSLTTVAPDDLTPVYPTTNDQVTLITCGSYNFLQDSYLERIVVVAERVS